MYRVITENDESPWDDVTGVKYHFPAQYLNKMQRGSKIIYYKGRLNGKKSDFPNRQFASPHYFGSGKIGRITKESKTNSFYAEIIDYVKFKNVVPFKIDNTYLEVFPPHRNSNYFRGNSVRQISKKVYDKILSLSNSMVESQLTDDQQSTELRTVIYMEGGKKKVYTTTYERNKTVRTKAIEIHGHTCQCCDFNFEEAYGECGKEYIHVHHLKPISTTTKKTSVNPRTDFAVVCANCHSMIHRKKGKLLSIAELRALIHKNV